MKYLAQLLQLNDLVLKRYPMQLQGLLPTASYILLPKINDVMKFHQRYFNFRKSSTWQTIAELVWQDIFTQTISGMHCRSKILRSTRNPLRFNHLKFCINKLCNLEVSVGGLVKNWK